MALAMVEKHFLPFGDAEVFLEASWHPLRRHVGPLEALKANMLIFSWFHKGLAAQVPWVNRHKCSEPEPWRG